MAEKADKIKLRSRDEIARILRDKPSAWTEMLAARASLRVFPLVAPLLASTQKEARGHSLADVVLPLLQAVALSWLAPLVSSHNNEVRGAAARISSNADIAADAAHVVARSANVTNASNVNAAHAARAVAAAVRAVIATAILADARKKAAAAGYNTVTAAAVSSARNGGAWAIARTADAANAAIRTADVLLSHDMDCLIEAGFDALAEAPLWPEGDVPPLVDRSWTAMVRIAQGLEGSERWRAVWLDWYEAIRDGRAPWGLRRQTGEALLIEAMLWSHEEWSKGATHINRRIAELIEAARGSRDEAAADESAAAAAPDAEIMPPAEPLPEQNSAVRFGVVAGKVEVLPTQAWEEGEVRAGPYFNRAVQLAEGLHARLQGSNAVPDVAGAVAALLAVLGSNVEQVEPDLLRMAARSIASKARSYGHPQAEWELNPDAVSELFELDGALVDLQGFVRGAIAANEAEIRALDLKPDQAAAIKEAVDELSDAIVAEPTLFSADTQAVFAAAAIAGDSALDPIAATTIQASRLLVAESLTRSLALEVSRSEPATAGLVSSSGPDIGAQGEAGASAPRERKPALRDRKAATQGSGSADAQAWSRFTTRLLERIGKKGPEKIGDAVIDAVCSAIRHAPKTMPAVGAALVALFWSNPILAASSGLTISASWIGYELWKRSRRPKGQAQ